MTVTENQTNGLSIGVKAGGPIFPTVKARISNNLIEGMAPTNFVHGKLGSAIDGSNGPQP